jgi:hypothetical protein
VDGRFALTSLSRMFWYEGRNSVLCYASYNGDFGPETVQLSQYICHITVKSGQRNVMKTQLIGTQCQIMFLKMNIGYYGAAFIWTNIKLRNVEIKIAAFRQYITRLNSLPLT